MKATRPIPSGPRRAAKTGSSSSRRAGCRAFVRVNAKKFRTLLGAMTTKAALTDPGRSACHHCVFGHSPAHDRVRADHYAGFDDAPTKDSDSAAQPDIVTDGHRRVVNAAFTNRQVRSVVDVRGAQKGTRVCDANIAADLDTALANEDALFVDAYAAADGESPGRLNVDGWTNINVGSEHGTQPSKQRNSKARCRPAFGITD